MHNIVEEWRDIVGYEGIYQVSSLGRVKSLARIAKNRHSYRPIRERILKQSTSPAGYPGVNLPKNAKPKPYRVHRLVAEAFIPNPENKPCVDHINSVRDDNRLTNLTWATYSENNQRSIDRLGGNSDRGESNKLSVLKEEEVIQICELLDKGDAVQKDIAQMYNVNPTTISNIYRGLAWNWLTGRKSTPGGHYSKLK